MHFQCIPVDPETAERFRRSGVDDGSNPIQRRIVDTPGAPCRQCLRDAEVGEEMLLLSWHLPRPLGIYWTPSPIFLHAKPCTAFQEPDVIAPIVRAPAADRRRWLVRWCVGRRRSPGADGGP